MHVYSYINRNLGFTKMERTSGMNEESLRITSCYAPDYRAFDIASIGFIIAAFIAFVFFLFFFC